MHRRVVGAVLLLGLLAACGRPAAPRVLRVGTTADEYVTARDASRLAMYPLNANVAEPLVRLLPDYTVAPALAVRWEYRGGNTWRFHLRANVRFHDGRPLTADAVRWSFGRVVRSATGTTFMSENSTVVVDDRTVDVTPSLPNLRLVEQLVHPTYAIVAPGSEPGEAVIGTGPFRVLDYRRGEYLAVTRFDGYWGQRPALDGIRFRFFPDPTSRLMALLAGELDIATDVPREQASALTAMPGVQVSRTPLGQTLLVYLNRHGAPPYVHFSEPAVRRAFAMAIDRRALVTDVWKGEGVVVQSMTPPALLGDESSRIRGVATSPVAAASMLEAAGWRLGPDGIRHRHGRRLAVVLLARRDVSAGTGELLHAQLRAVGVEMTVAEVPDLASYQVRLRAGEFDGALEAPNQNDANPVFLPALRLSALSANRTSRWFLTGEPFEAAVARALGSESTEDARRWSAEAMRVAIDEETTVVPLAGLRRIFAASRRVRGLVPHPSFTSQSWREIALDPGQAP